MFSSSINPKSASNKLTARTLKTRKSNLLLRIFQTNDVILLKVGHCDLDAGTAELINVRGLKSRHSELNLKLTMTGMLFILVNRDQTNHFVFKV